MSGTYLLALAVILAASSCKLRDSSPPGNLLTTEQGTGPRKSFTESFIETCSDCKSVVDALGHLPKEMLEKYSLIYSSKSLDRNFATPQMPRVVLTSKDGLTAVAFPGRGRPDAAGEFHEHIEIIEFDSMSGLETPTRINFYPMRTSNFLVPERNPSVCGGCHSSKDPSKGREPWVFRLRWDQYPFWPGVYGSVHIPGRLAYENDKKQNFFANEDAIVKDDIPVILGSEEMKNLAEFLQRNAQTGVYKFLPDLPKPELDPTTSQAKPLDPLIVARFARKLSIENSDKTTEFNGRNVRRIFKFLSKQSNFNSNILALHDAALGLSDPQLDEPTRKDIEIRMAIVAKAQSARYAERSAAGLKNPPIGDGSYADALSVGAMMHLTDKMGLSMDYWATSSSEDDSKKYLFNDGITSLQPIAMEVIRYLGSLKLSVLDGKLTWNQYELCGTKIDPAYCEQSTTYLGSKKDREKIIKAIVEKQKSMR